MYFYFLQTVSLVVHRKRKEEDTRPVAELRFPWSLSVCTCLDPVVDRFDIINQSCVFFFRFVLHTPLLELNQGTAN